MNVEIRIGLAFCLAGSGASGVSAHGLMDVYHMAQTQDAQHLAAQRVLDAALEKLPQARAALLPELQLSAGRNRQVGSASFSDAPWLERTPTSWSWTLQLSQPLLGGAHWSAYQQAAAEVTMAKAHMDGARQDLILRCAQVYLDLLLAQEAVSVAQAQLTTAQAQLVLVQRRLDVGSATVTDVHEARARQALAQSQHIAAVAGLEVQEAALVRLLGRPLALRPMKITATLPPLDPSQEDFFRHARAAHPQVRAQEAALEMARLEIVRRQHSHGPSLDLTGSLASQYSSGSLGSPVDGSSRVASYAVGLQLTVPIFSGGGTRSRVREAIALQDKAAADLLSAQRTAQMQVQQALSGMRKGQAQAEALRVAVEASEAAVAGQGMGLRIGTRITPDVLQARQQLVGALHDLTQARIETVMHGLQLKAAAGQLHAADLAAVERLLESPK